MLKARLGSDSSMRFHISPYLPVIGSSAQSVIGNLVSSPDSIAQGDAKTVWLCRFAAKRPTRLLDLERYRELNQQNKGIVKVFDIDTPIQTQEDAE